MAGVHHSFLQKQKRMLCVQDKAGQAYDSAAQGAKQAQDYTQVGASGWNTCSAYNCAAQGLEVQLVRSAST